MHQFGANRAASQQKVGPVAAPEQFAGRVRIGEVFLPPGCGLG